MISQAHAHGDKRKYLVALITVGAGEAVEWARQKAMIDNATAERHLRDLANNPLARTEELESLLREVTRSAEVQERLVASVRRANEGLARVETINKISVLDRELSVEEDELTPTHKMTRKNIESKFAETFDRLYQDERFGLVVLSS